MNGVYDAKTLETERQAFRAVQTFVSVVHYSAMIIIALFVLIRISEHGLAWPGVLLTIPCAGAVWLLGSTINQGSGVFRHLSRWETSIFRRQDFLDASESLKAGDQVFIDFREVTLFEGVVVPKPGGKCIVPN